MLLKINNEAVLLASSATELLKKVASLAIDNDVTGTIDGDKFVALSNHHYFLSTTVAEIHESMERFPPNLEIYVQTFFGKNIYAPIKLVELERHATTTEVNSHTYTTISYKNNLYVFLSQYS